MWFWFPPQFKNMLAKNICSVPHMRLQNTSALHIFIRFPHARCTKTPAHDTGALSGVTKNAWARHRCQTHLKKKHVKTHLFSKHCFVNAPNIIAKTPKIIQNTHTRLQRHFKHTPPGDRTCAEEQALPQDPLLPWRSRPQDPHFRCGPPGSNGEDWNIMIHHDTWVNYNELTTSSLEIIVSKGNHPQMALIQVSELL